VTDQDGPGAKLGPVKGPGPRPATQPALSNSILIVLLGNLFPAFVALITGPILAQSLAVDGRGAVAAATAPLTLITTITTSVSPKR